MTVSFGHDKAQIKQMDPRDAQHHARHVVHEAERRVQRYATIVGRLLTTVGHVHRRQVLSTADRRSTPIPLKCSVSRAGKTVCRKPVWFRTAAVSIQYRRRVTDGHTDTAITTRR